MKRGAMSGIVILLCAVGAGAQAPPEHTVAFLAGWSMGSDGRKIPVVGPLFEYNYSRGWLEFEGAATFTIRGKVGLHGPFRELKVQGLARVFFAHRGNVAGFFEGGAQVNRASLESAAVSYVKVPVYPIAGAGFYWGHDVLIKGDWFFRDTRTADRVEGFRATGRADWYPWTGRRLGFRVESYFQVSRYNDTPIHRTTFYTAGGGIGIVIRSAAYAARDD